MSLDRKIPLIMPNALMAFHWPRVDLDKLLCLRYDIIITSSNIHCTPPHTHLPIKQFSIQLAYFVSKVYIILAHLHLQLSFFTLRGTSFSFLSLFKELTISLTVSGVEDSLLTKTVPFTSTCEATTVTRYSFAVRLPSREPPTTLSSPTRPTTPLLSDLRTCRRFPSRIVNLELVERTLCLS